MKKFVLFFLFLTVISYSQNATEQKLDSLLLLLKTKKEDTSKVNLYHKIVLINRDFDFNSTAKYNAALLTLTKKLNYKRGLGLYYLNNSFIFSKRDLFKSIFYAKQARKTFLKVNDTLYYLKATCYLADALSNDGKYNEAKQVLLSNVKLSEKKSHFKMTGIIYQQIGSLFLTENSPKKSLNYLKKSLEYHQKEKSPNNNISFLYMYIAYVNNKLSNHDEALTYSNLSIQFAEKDLQKHFMILEKINTYLGMELYSEAIKLALENDSFYVQNNLTYNNNYTYNLLFISKSYFYLKKYHQAIKVANKILNQSNLNNDLISDTNKLIANSYFKLDNKREANKFIDKAISFYNILTSQENDKLAQLYLDKSIIEESLGNDKTALYYNRKYSALKEKMEAIINADKIRELQIDFNIADKNNKIKDLKISHSIKENEIKKQKNYIILIFVALLFALLSILFFVKMNRSTKRKNELITIANIKLANEQLSTQKSLTEKEILLKEIHHRVKNNLQLVISLLNVQSRVSESNIETFVRTSRSRIVAMAMIHENLYQSENLNKINFKEYLLNLTNAISATYESIDKKITLQLQVDTVHLDIQIAMSLGLIVNELVNNAFKHAFTNKKEGIISLELIKHDEIFKLIIADDGCNKKTPNKNKETLGLQLVSLLVSQINGVMHILNTNGLSYQIEFQNLKI